MAILEPDKIIIKKPGTGILSGQVTPVCRSGSPGRKSPNHQITKSSNHQIIKSSNHQIIKLSN
jgi:hypothetical protein